MRCALFLPIFAIATILMGFSSTIAALFDRSGRVSHQFAKYWSRFIFWGVGIQVQVKGEENIPANQAVIFAANHQSTLDIPAMFGYLPAQFRIMAKQILFHVPFLGWHLYLSGNIPIDRKNTKQAFSSVFRASARIRDGISLFVFAEGTRSRDGRLQRFKRGSFTLAKKLNVPVVPVAIQGTFDLMPSGAVLAKPGKILLQIMKPIPVSPDESTDQLATLVRKEFIEAGLQDSDPQETHDNV